MKPAEPVRGDVQAFYDFLKARAHGQANAMPARDLALCLELPRASGDRILRQLVHAANEAGLLVVADNNGYFCPASPEEAQEAIGRLRSQAAEMLERARRIESLCTRTFYAQQMSLL